jgi:hypothetical protein
VSDSFPPESSSSETKGAGVNLGSGGKISSLVSSSL